VRKHCEQAHQIAAFMAARKGIERVLYPGLESHPQHALAKAQMDDFGSVICLYIEGGKQAAFNFMNAFRLIDISNNLGDTKSLATHPATTTHQRLAEEERLKLGITDGLVRISVGLEDTEDIKEDLEQALAKASVTPNPIHDSLIFLDCVMGVLQGFLAGTALAQPVQPKPDRNPLQRAEKRLDEQGEPTH